MNILHDICKPFLEAPRDKQGYKFENLKKYIVYAKEKIDLVFRVLRILVTSALFWSIVTHLRVKCSPPKTPASCSRLPQSLSLVRVCVILSNDGSSGECWTSKYHQNHRVPAARCLPFFFIYICWFGNSAMSVSLCRIKMAALPHQHSVTLRQLHWEGWEGISKSGLPGVGHKNLL